MNNNVLDGLQRAHDYLDVQKNAFHNEFPNESTESFDDTMAAIQSAIALLNEHEPVVGLPDGYKPIVSTGETKYYQCSICLQAIDVGDNYCRLCGRKVKW